MSEAPVKSLGKMFDETLGDGNNRKNTVYSECEEKIPTVSEAPVKSLGKMFDETLWDGNNRMAITMQIQSLDLSTWYIPLDIMASDVI